MPEPLEKKTCGACQKGAPRLNLEEAMELHKQLHPDWKLRDRPDNPASDLNRLYVFKDFAKALDFVNDAGKLMDAEGHHAPNIQIADFNRVWMLIYTAKIGGLHENDFILAKKMDQLPSNPAP